MGVTRSAILLLLLTCGCETRSPEPLCVLTPARMPETWRPSGKVKQRQSIAPWSADEANDAAYAVQTGFEELSDFFMSRPATVQALGDDAVEPLIDASYAAGNMPLLQAAARDSARRVLSQLLTPYLVRSTKSANCKEFSFLVDLAIYAHALSPTGDTRISSIVALTNAAYRDCGSLPAAIGYDYRRTLAGPNVSTKDVWNLVMWSITLTDAQLVPGLELPAEASDLPPTLWRFLGHYPLTGAPSQRDGPSDETFYDTAYLATHIAYIPTGYGRYPVYVADSPGLYHFLRQNFYAVLERGELDLVAEFVDLFRQYGCWHLRNRQGTRLSNAVSKRLCGYHAPHK